VQQQKGRISRLRAAGVDTRDAQKILSLLESNLRRFEEHRDGLRATAGTCGSDHSNTLAFVAFATPPALPGSFVTKARILSITGSLLPRWSETIVTYRKPGRGLPQKVESFQWLSFSIQTIRQTIDFGHSLTGEGSSLDAILTKPGGHAAVIEVGAAPN
jgi:hypothetical protein